MCSTRAPTNKFLLAGSVERLRGDPQADFGLVDVYGLLLSSRLMVPRDELSVDDRDLKLSNQRFYLSNGANPLPIYASYPFRFAVSGFVLYFSCKNCLRSSSSPGTCFSTPISSQRRHSDCETV